MFADESTADGLLWALADQQGTVRDWADYASGTNTTTIANHVVYDSFGNITSQSSGTHKPLFAFTGREWDADAELHYYRLRWYDPAVGEFIGEDPSGFAAGDANLDRYVGNGPTNFVDPFGLEATTPTGGFTGGTGAAMYPDWYPAWIESMRLNRGDGVSFDTMGDWGYYHVYDTPEWFWQEETYVGTVRFDRTDPDDYDIAMQVARQMEIGVGLEDIGEHVGAGVATSEIMIRMAHGPLDTALSATELYNDPSLWNVLAMAPFVPGGTSKYLDNIAEHSKKHFPGQTTDQIKRYITDVENGFKQMHEFSDGTKLYLKGDFILWVHKNGEGSIYKPDMKAYMYYLKSIRERAG